MMQGRLFVSFVWELRGKAVGKAGGRRGAGVWWMGVSVRNTDRRAALRQAQASPALAGTGVPRAARGARPGSTPPANPSIDLARSTFVQLAVPMYRYEES